MKHFSFFTLIVFCLTVFTTTVNAENLTIKAGTQVLTVLNQTLTSKNVHEGETVMLNLVSPIKVNKTVVIPAGSIVNAQVAYVEGAGWFGQKGELTLRLISINAPDGTLVPIQATHTVSGKNKVVLSVALGVCICPLFWIMHGGQAVIPAGSNIYATVLANTDIEI